MYYGDFARPFFIKQKKLKTNNQKWNKIKKGKKKHSIFNGRCYAVIHHGTSLAFYTRIVHKCIGTHFT